MACGFRLHGFGPGCIRDFVKPGCFRSVRLCLGAPTCARARGWICAIVELCPKRKKAFFWERAFVFAFFVILVAGAGFEPAAFRL